MKVWLRACGVLLLMCIAAQDEATAEGSDVAREMEEDMEEAARDQAIREILDDLENPIPLNMRPGVPDVVVFGVPRNETFPDVLITLAGVFPVTNTDLYCKPGGTTAQLVVGDLPHQNDFVWKSDHQHGVDYIFMSRHDPRFQDVVITTEEGVDTALFVCTMIERSLAAALVTLEIDVDYDSRSLVDEEQQALESIFEACCQGEDQCQRWKEHMDLDNANATDFCHFEGSICNEDGNLLRLNLDEMNMTCEFPGEQLAQFPFLQKLTLWRNNLMGRTSDVLEDLLALDNLHQLALSDAMFEGPLAEDPSDPDSAICQLARAGNLRDLSLRNCSISGSLPSCLFDEDSELRAINLAHNELTGELPAVSVVNSSLLHLILNNNELTGELPSEWTAFPGLQWMILSNNQLSGQIPEGLSSIMPLQAIRLGGNRFTGPFPPDALNGGSLRELNVSYNQLSGDLTVNVDNTTDLLFVVMDHNEFSGPLPVGFVNASQLIYLGLENNQFTGEIPEDYGSFRSLRALYLNDNSLSGQLPSSFGNLADLTFLNLHANQLTGTIPDDFRFMYDLSILTLDDNQLEGEIPGWMLQAAPLLPTNRLSINISSNMFTGFNEIWYADRNLLSRLVEFYAADNQIEGEIPQNLALQDTLFYVNLAGNEMSGPLPSQEGVFVNALELNLSSNAFTGEIPASWENISMFTANEFTLMDLSFNQLSGELPAFLFKQSSSNIEREFYLQGNRFEFECPNSNALDHVQDLDCDDSFAADTIRDPDPTRDEGFTTVTQLSAPNSMEDSGSSSSSVLVPVLVTVAAVGFAVGVVVIAVLLRSFKRQRQFDGQATIPMSTIAVTNGTHTKMTDDSIHMLSGVDSRSAAL